MFEHHIDVGVVKGERERGRGKESGAGLTGSDEMRECDATRWIYDERRQRRIHLARACEIAKRGI